VSEQQWGVKLDVGFGMRSLVILTTLQHTLQFITQTSILQPVAESEKKIIEDVVLLSIVFLWWVSKGATYFVRGPTNADFFPRRSTLAVFRSALRYESTAMVCYGYERKTEQIS